MKKLFTLAGGFGAMLTSAAFAADNHDTFAKPWQLGFQEAATPVMKELTWMHDSILLPMCIGISVLVLAVMVYICIKFNRKNNPVASKTTHNTKLEIIWTAIPVLILILIAIPSLRLHYFMERDIEAEMTLKVVGHQWYWHYEYPDHGGFGFDSYMLKDNDLKQGDVRLLSVDNEVVVPVDTKIKVHVTGADVIHAWAVPAFGVKRDAIPGRLNETWFKATKIGTFYGQCSELCGVGHGFMPIEVKVVSKEDFATWVAAKKKEAGIADAKPEEKPTLASANTQNKTKN
jgi:cytochrome c oxidase subunit 2